MLSFNGLVNRIGGQQMRANLFWFSDGQWARIEPFIPSNRRDKAYDSNSFRKSLRKDGIKPVIPGRSNRKKRIRHDKQAYKDRNVIERCYCRLKDFRRIATRYDKLARNYFSALCLVAAVAFWL